MGNAKELPTVISFCSGYGGIERGLDLIGVEHRVIAYCEIEAYAIANLLAKMEAGLLVPAPVYTSLATFPAHLFRDAVDIIVGGYPCQPFSTAGKREGESDPRHLWPFIRRHTQAIRPSRVFFENVEGHISLGLSSVISDLEEDGYRTTWGIFSASEVGAPHQRKRVYIMGDSEYNGLLAPEERGSDLEDGYRAKERQVEAIEPEGAGKPQSDRDLSGGQELADTKGERVQGLWASGEQESDSHGQKKLPLCESQGRIKANWTAEPRLDRVVDGGPNRVDRIRLLGNGVVPQTAAKAWNVLNRRMYEEN